MSSIVEVKVDDPGFSQAVMRTVGRTANSMREAFTTQGRLLCAELMKWTPPFSGKSIAHMLDARGASLRDGDVESLSALAVGKRRIEKDIRKNIFGVKSPTAPPARPAVYMGQDSHRTRTVDNLTSWGKLQKCEGRDAIRIFATKGGEVYGVDYMNFAADASMQDLERTHAEHRGKRGRVTVAGSKDRVVGRWRWLNLLTTKEETVKRFIAKAWHGVGNARGGWAEGLITLGGKLSPRGWVGKHRKAGSCEARFDRGNVSISIVNHSKWATGGDPDRIIPKVLAGREKAIEASIEHSLDQAWEKDQWGRK